LRVSLIRRPLIVRGPCYRRRRVPERSADGSPRASWWSACSRVAVG